MSAVYHGGMRNVIVAVDMGLFIRAGLSDSGDAVSLHADDTPMLIDSALPNDYDDARIVLGFDEPPFPGIPFNPEMSRHGLLPAYDHLGYNPCNPDIRIPVQEWKQNASRLGYVLSYPGAEARDMISAFIDCMTPLRGDDYDTIIVSDDPALLQTIADGKRVKAFMVPASGKESAGCLLNERGVASMFGAGPSNMRMMLSLCGNPVDGYQGVETCEQAEAEIRESIRSIPAKHKSDGDILERNWRLAGIGGDYLDHHAMMRARSVMAWAVGPEF